MIIIMIIKDVAYKTNTYLDAADDAENMILDADKVNYNDDIL